MPNVTKFGKDKRKTTSKLVAHSILGVIGHKRYVSSKMHKNVGIFVSKYQKCTPKT